MSNGYLTAAAADLPAAREIAEGFGLEIVEASAVGDPEAVAAALAAAPNLGVVLSLAAAQDEAFLALLRSLAARAPRAQLIVVEPEARAAFGFLPDTWPVMALSEARIRAEALASSRTAPAPEPPQAPPAAADAEAEAPPPVVAAEPEPEPPPAPETEAAAPAAAPPEAIEAPKLDEPQILEAERDLAPAEPGGGEEQRQSSDDFAAARAPAPVPVPAPSPAPSATRGPEAAPPAAQAPPHKRMSTTRAQDGVAREQTARADATAFAPKKLRRNTPELVRVVIHQPKDLAAVIKAARKIDPSAEPAPQGMPIGDIAFGARIGVSLDVRGAACDGAIQRREWEGEPIDFAFTVEADGDARQAVLLARVFIDDAQIGVIAFTRPISGAAKKPASADRVRLKRHKRVFLSYSSHDRATVSVIARAYEMAGVEHFWDRASLKSGEEWSPRLRREIDRADLFHLCWSRSASASQWVVKETEHALDRRRRIRKPDITVQMLDGPPWAPHPASLDSINFDDFVRAAIVGYARGEQ